MDEIAYSLCFFLLGWPVGLIFGRCGHLVVSLDEFGQLVSYVDELSQLVGSLDIVGPLVVFACQFLGSLDDSCLLFGSFDETGHPVSSLNNDGLLAVF